MQTKLNAFEIFLKSLPPFHFVTAEKLPELINLHRLCRCVVRCGNCRFIAPAQDIPHLKKAIESIGDYVRDVSIYSFELDNAHNWQPEVRPAPFVKQKTVFTKTDNSPVRIPIAFREEECGGVFDGNKVISDADPGL